jgi:predicted ABC-type ATPase
LGYVLLDSVERNVERVRIRVAKGGHGVPENKVRDRHRRSLDQLPWFLDQADRAWLFDNSGATLRLIGQKTKGVTTLAPTALPEVVKAVGKISSN